eukprot:scaffold79385_cov27-Tisochrysis_lutea.AAC.3
MVWAPRLSCRLKGRRPHHRTRLTAVCPAPQSQTCAAQSDRAELVLSRPQVGGRRLLQKRAGPLEMSRTRREAGSPRLGHADEERVVYHIVGCQKVDVLAQLTRDAPGVLGRQVEAFAHVEILEHLTTLLENLAATPNPRALQIVPLMHGTGGGEARLDHHHAHLRAGRPRNTRLITGLTRARARGVQRPRGWVGRCAYALPVEYELVRADDAVDERVRVQLHVGVVLGQKTEQRRKLLPRRRLDDVPPVVRKIEEGAWQVGGRGRRTCALSGMLRRRRVRAEGLRRTGAALGEALRLLAAERPHVVVGRDARELPELVEYTWREREHAHGHLLATRAVRIDVRALHNAPILAVTRALLGGEPTRARSRRAFVGHVVARALGHEAVLERGGVANARGAESALGAREDEQPGGRERYVLQAEEDRRGAARNIVGEAEAVPQNGGHDRREEAKDGLAQQDGRQRQREDAPALREGCVALHAVQDQLPRVDKHRERDAIDGRADTDQNPPARL